MANESICQAVVFYGQNSETLKAKVAIKNFCLETFHTCYCTWILSNTPAEM